MLQDFFEKLQKFLFNLDNFTWSDFKSNILNKDNGEAFTSALASHDYS